MEMLSSISAASGGLCGQNCSCSSFQRYWTRYFNGCLRRSIRVTLMRTVVDSSPPIGHKLLASDLSCRMMSGKTVPSGLQKRANPRGPGGQTTQVGSQDKWLPPKCKTHPACANARAEQRSGPSCNYHGQTPACRGLPIDNAPSARVTIHQYPCGPLLT